MRRIILVSFLALLLAMPVVPQSTGGGQGAIGQASGTGSCTNQAVTALNAGGAPTCTTLTASYVDSTIAKTGTANTFSAAQTFTGVGSAHPGNTVALTADWTCGTGGTVTSCTAATIIGSGGGVPLTFTLPAVAQSYTLECDGVVGQATAATANNWNLLTATNGATNVTSFFDMFTAAGTKASGATTDQATTTTTFTIGGTWTLGGTGTKMPFHVWAKIEGASASGTVVSLQLVAPTVGDLVTIYRGTSCRLF